MGISLNTRQLALLSLLTAVGVAIQTTVRPPNVEFTSFISFTLGAVLGFRAGAIAGGTTMFINGFFSPWGHGGLNIPFQMTGMIIAGIVGHIYKAHAPDRVNTTRFCVETAVLGSFIALVYDLITNVGFGFQYILAGMDPVWALISAIAYGSFYSLVHIVSNTVVFGFLFLPLASAISGFNANGSELCWSKKERLNS